MKSITSKTRRKYRWNPRRFVMSLAFVATVLAVVMGLGLGRQVASADSGQNYPEVTVAAGDTLWDIASRLDIRGDKRDVVERIRDLNDLGARPIQPGEVLRVPGS